MAKQSFTSAQELSNRKHVFPACVKLIHNSALVIATNAWPATCNILGDTIKQFKKARKAVQIS